MENKPKLSRFNKRKKSNYKKALVLIFVLLAVIYFYSNADELLNTFFGE